MLKASTRPTAHSTATGAIRHFLGAITQLKKHKRLIAFARYPEAGRVKTRLIPAIGGHRAARLYAALLNRTMATAAELRSDGDVGLELRVTDGHLQEMYELAASSFAVRRQCGGDLGIKLSEAARSAFDEGVQKLVMIGTDCPQLSSNTLKHAFAALDDADIVLGPALDGGYYLIATRQYVAGLFEGMDWGSDRVLTQTRTKAKELGLRVCNLQPLSDIDYVEDLVICRNRSPHFANAFPQVQPGLLSVIIPAFNEEGSLATTLRSLNREKNVEVIVVDGGSTDRTVEVAKQFASNVIPCRKGRGRQLNAGAAISRGEALLFLHADSQLPNGFADTIWSTLKGDAIAGAFKLGIDSTDARLRWVESGANLRSRFLQAPYGDQGLFLSSDTFFKVGGYRHWPLMEDYDLCRRLRGLGRIAIAPQSIITSARRWRQLGIVQTTLLNQMCVAAFCLGVSPDQLAKWYSIQTVAAPVRDSKASTAPKTGHDVATATSFQEA